jgi:hypothetical protein
MRPKEVEAALQCLVGSSVQRSTETFNNFPFDHAKFMTQVYLQKLSTIWLNFAHLPIFAGFVCIVLAQLRKPSGGKVDSGSNFIRLILSDQFVHNLEPEFDRSTSTARSDDVSINDAVVRKYIGESFRN